MKIGQILTKLSELGAQGISNTEQFKHEGKYSNGKKDRSDVAVFAVKANQLRVYGGFKAIDDQHVFVGVEAAKKKKNKADLKQLQRVAKVLGEING